MSDIDVFIHFPENYLSLMCQPKDVLDMLGSSHKCTYAFDLQLSAFDCVVQTKYLYII